MSEEQQQKVRVIVRNAMRWAVQSEKNDLPFSERVKEWSDITDEAMKDINAVIEHLKGLVGDE